MGQPDLPMAAMTIRIEHKDGSYVNCLRSTLGLGGYDFESMSLQGDINGRGTVGLGFLAELVNSSDTIWVDGEKWTPGRAKKEGQANGEKKPRTRRQTKARKDEGTTRARSDHASTKARDDDVKPKDRETVAATKP